MLIAHAPAGYIVAKKLNYAEKPAVISSAVFAVWPDIDLVYYYGWDHVETFHHLYFPHLPIVLLGCLLAIATGKDTTDMPEYIDGVQTEEISAGTIFVSMGETFTDSPEPQSVRACLISLFGGFLRWFFAIQGRFFGHSRKLCSKNLTR